MASPTTRAAANGGSAAASGPIATRGSDAHAPGSEQAGTSDPASRIAPGRVRIDRYDLDLGPWLHLADERARLASPSFRHIEVTPQGATLGAEVAGVNLGTGLPDEVVAEIRKALLDYKILVFRDQPITPAQHVAFARRFGELEIHPFITGNSDHPELVRFEKGVDTGGFENGWHHDVTWREVPSMGAILHAVQVPATGGDTLFSDMGAAYDGLGEAVKEQIDGLFAIHDFMLAFRHQVPEGKQAEFRARYPPARHPVVCTHPETGRRLIFVNCYFTSHIDGMDESEGVDLIRHLAGQASVVEYQFRVRWEPGTVVFWDNRSVQHYAASDYYPDVRIMERASIVGTRPA
ncbi:MAG: TauD/TfdA family dioxygenase [Acidimicrobiaceae bacterium]|nr:TauD/TfdA family dioxygenase [Acidimicrobiaceae bacterium]